MKWKIGWLMGLTLVLAVSVGLAQTQKVLVVSTWGYNEDKFRANVFAPFERANNVKIVLEVGNNGERLNKLKIMKKSTVDVIGLAESFSLEGIKAGLFEKVDPAKLPNLKEIYAIAKEPMKGGYGPAYTIQRTGIIYDSKITATPITAWADLWREEFKQNITIPDITITSGPPFIAAAAAVAGTTVTEDDNQAFQQLLKLKPNVVKIYTRSSDLNNMFIQKEVQVGVAQDFAFPRIKEAIPSAVFVDPKEGSFANMNTLNIVKGSKNKELAHKFINWWLSAEVQSANALDKLDSPVNTKVTLTAKQAEGLTYGEAVIKNLKPLDWEYINVAMASWIERWNRQIAN